MEIILKEDIENLGLAYDIVNVKPGFARNFLIPQGKASLALPSERKKLEDYLSTIEEKEGDLIKEAKKIAEKLKKVTIKIIAKTGAGDKLFGSINNSDLITELEKEGISIERRFVKIPGNSIKRIGKYIAKIRLHRTIEHDFEFEITPEVTKTDKPKVVKAAKVTKAAKSVELKENTGEE